VADFHAADLWVAVVPDASKVGPAMEEAGKEAKGKFGAAVKGIGDTIHDDLTKVGDKVKDVFHKTGTDSGKAMTEGFKKETKGVEDAAGEAGTKAKSKFKETLGDVGKEFVNAINPDMQRELTTRLDSVVGGAVKSVLGKDGIGGTVGGLAGNLAGSVFDFSITDIKAKLAATKDAVNDTKKAFADLAGGKTADGIAGLVTNFGKLEPLAKQFGFDVKDLPQPIQDAATQISGLKSTTEEFAGIFKDLPGKIGMVGTAISELAGPIAVAAAAAMTIWNGIPGVGGGLKQIMDPANSRLDTSPGALGLPSTSLSVQTPAGQMALPGMPQPVDANSLPAGLPPGVQYQATQGSLDPFAALGGAPVNPSAPQPLVPIVGGNQHPFITPPGLPPSPIQMDMPDGVAPPPITPRQVAPSARGPSVFAGGPRPARHVGSESGLTPTSKAVEDVLATMFPQISDIGGWRPPDGYNEHSSGQALDVMIPNSNTPQGQALGTQVKDYVLAHAKELGVDYALWQQTQWNPGGSHSGMENRGDPNQNHFTHVHVHTVRGGGDPSAPPDSTYASGGSGSGSSGSGGGGSSGGGSGGAGGGGGGFGGGGGPAGTPNDPIFVSIAGQGPGGGPGGPGGGPGGAGGDDGGMGDMTNLLSAGMSDAGLGNVLSPFGSGKSPMNFGLAKMATGLMGLFPHPGATATAGVKPGAGPTPAAGTPGNTTIIHGDVNTGPNVTQNGVASPTQDLQAATNAAAAAAPVGPLP
jgi:hypothetical protein